MEENNSNEVGIKELLAENLKLTREIHKMSRKVNRYVAIQSVLSVIYFLLIAVPLILGAIYFPYFIKNVVNPYQKLLENSNNLQNAVGNPSAGIGDMLNQAQKFLNEKSNK